MVETFRSRALVPPADWLSADRILESRRLDTLFLALVTLLALLIRLYRLGEQSLWTDEILTWKMIRPGAGLHFWRQLADSIQGPLYLAVAWPLVRWSGSAWVLRLPAALAGAATVPVIFACGRRLWNAPTARLAALLLALSPFHLWYSQEARGYTFLILFAAAASLVFLDMVRRGPDPRRALLYALLTALAIWSSMTALFLWGAQLLTLLFLERPRGRRAALCWLLAMGGALVAAVPYLLKAAGILAVGRLLPGSATGEALRGETTFTPLAYLFTAYSFFFGYSLGPSLQDLHQPDRLAALRAAWPVVLPASLVATAALGAGLLRLRRRRALLILWIGVPVLAVTWLALRNIKPFNPRYLAVIFPWVLLLAAGGLLALPRRWSMALSAALLGLFLVAVAGDLFNPRYAKADLRGAAAIIADRGSPAEPILVPVAAPVFAYYFRGPGKLVANWDFRILRSAAEAREFLSSRLDEAPSAWLVLSRIWRVDPDGWLPRVLAEDGRILSDTRLPGVRILHWRRGGEVLDGAD